MLLRNREVRRALIASIICTLAGCTAAYLITRGLLERTGAGAYLVATTVDAVAPTGSAATALTLRATARAVALAASCCAGLTGAVVTAIFTALTAHRYRALGRMADNLDRVLAGERDISLRDMEEGELAILSSEVDKVIARLNLTVDELQAEKLALSDSLADISHQLKTPLTSIAISTELVRDRLADRGDSRDLVERLRLVQRLQGRVEDLVAALLKLARIDAGVIKLVHSPVDAAELLRRSVEPLAVAFDIADVALETDVAQGACFIGDITWSVEALENILKNCVEHTPAGGAVRVRIVEDVLACRIHIEDTGPGIAEDDLPHIFERFYRGEESTHAASELNPAGVGIGLALAKSLVSAQGGTLTAHNVTDAQGNVTGAAFDMVFFKSIV